MVCVIGDTFGNCLIVITLIRANWRYNIQNDGESEENCEHCQTDKQDLVINNPVS